MNELASLGIILLFALLAGHLVKYARVPEVTGYILAGVAVGPSVLGWISHENLATLEVFSEVALGLILFSIGTVFEMKQFSRIGPKLMKVTLTESLLAAVLVTGGMLLVGQPWQVALLLGAVAIETAAASTLMVLRECNAEGPLSETLTGIFALNNILCLIAFSLVAAAVEWSASGVSGGWASLYSSLYPLFWQLLGSMALGFLVGLLLAAWATRVVEHGERLILLAGCVLVCVGVSQWMELSPLVASLAVGATVVNVSPRSKDLFRSLGQTDPPFYAIFFVIAGADLNLGLLTSLGTAGLVYIVGRAAGKFLGARLGARLAGLPARVSELLGFGLMAQAGLAIGLTLTINRRFPELAPAITTVILASVIIYEMIGPVSARLAVVRSGEARPEQPAATGVFD